MRRNVNMKAREEINEEKNIANQYVIKLKEEDKAIKFVKIANVEKKFLKNIRLCSKN